MWTISTTNWNLPRFSPTCFARRKLWEISTCCRNYSQGRCSYFDFPLVSIKLFALIERVLRPKLWEVSLSNFIDISDREIFFLIEYKFKLVGSFWMVPTFPQWEIFSLFTNKFKLVLPFYMVFTFPQRETLSLFLIT